jgi:hypothetical protein
MTIGAYDVLLGRPQSITQSIIEYHWSLNITLVSLSALLLDSSIDYIVLRCTSSGAPVTVHLTVNMMQGISIRMDSVVDAGAFLSDERLSTSSESLLEPWVSSEMTFSRASRLGHWLLISRWAGRRAVRPNQERRTTTGKRIYCNKRSPEWRTCSLERAVSDLSGHYTLDLYRGFNACRITVSLRGLARSVFSPEAKRVMNGAGIWTLIKSIYQHNTGSVQHTKTDSVSNQQILPVPSCARALCVSEGSSPAALASPTWLSRYRTHLAAREQFQDFVRVEGGGWCSRASTTDFAGSRIMLQEALG